jgi:hypothetical protein
MVLVQILESESGFPSGLSQDSSPSKKVMLQISAAESNIEIGSARSGPGLFAKSSSPVDRRWRDEKSAGQGRAPSRRDRIGLAVGLFECSQQV